MNTKIFDELNLDIRQDAPLSEYTTFQLGGRCPLLVNCKESSEIQQLITRLNDEKIPFFVIGKGSNLVVSDEGLELIVVRYVCNKPQINLDGSELCVDAGTLLDDLVLFCAENGLEGINFASGIPGTVGGAICGNAGAFGKQLGDSICSVDLLSSSGAFQKNILPQELGFSYRHSCLKESGNIVLSAKFLLKKSDKEKLLEERKEILNLRREKHPDYSLIPTAGSFFRNIESASRAGKREAAGWYLEQAGAKEISVNGAEVYEGHANIIIKSRECSAQDVYELSEKMQNLVKEKFDIDLIREVRFVGKFNGHQEESLIW